MNRLLVTAHHEAGHATAVQMRGGTVQSIALKPGSTTFTLLTHRLFRFRNGVRVENPQPRERNTADDAFIAFAGPWAATRCRWPMPTLDVPDEDVHSFGEHLTAILQENTSDFAVYQDADKPPGADDMWNRELEEHWPRIQLAAGRMFAARRVNRPGMSGDSTSWEGWSHVRWFVEEVSAGAA
jgi:hypothetical protein